MAAQTPITPPPQLGSQLHSARFTKTPEGSQRAKKRANRSLAPSRAPSPPPAALGGMVPYESDQEMPSEDEIEHGPLEPLGMLFANMQLHQHSL